jgi:hypothetical protein
MNPRLFTFAGTHTGTWRVISLRAIVGESLPTATHLEIFSEATRAPTGVQWALRGITSNERYVTREEKNSLVAKQPTLHRLEATCGALILIRKNDAWWALTQDERRKIFEEQSNHVRTGLNFLPAIARRLHHCRDLGPNEPFDFLTWFEYAPADANAFDDLVGQLRASPEWAYVSREVDLRVQRG